MRPECGSGGPGRGMEGETRGARRPGVRRRHAFHTRTSPPAPREQPPPSKTGKEGSWRGDAVLPPALPPRRPRLHRGRAPSRGARRGSGRLPGRAHARSRRRWKRLRSRCCCSLCPLLPSRAVRQKPSANQRTPSPDRGQSARGTAGSGKEAVANPRAARERARREKRRGRGPGVASPGHAHYARDGAGGRPRAAVEGEGLQVGAGPGGEDERGGALWGWG